MRLVISPITLRQERRVNFLTISCLDLILQLETFPYNIPYTTLVIVRQYGKLCFHAEGACKRYHYPCSSMKTIPPYLLAPLR